MTSLPVAGGAGSDAPPATPHNATLSPDSASAPTTEARTPHPWRFRPGNLMRVLRVATQSLAWTALLLSPLFGAWQRADAGSMSSWARPEGWDPPAAVVAPLGSAHDGEAFVDVFPLQGGGTGVVYVGVPMIDPVPGIAGLTRTLPNATGALALILPLLAALLLGRVFCGWFCPFGTLSRGITLLLEVLPFAPKRFAIGEHRWIRFVVLGLTVGLSAFGFQGAVVLALPHLALSQSVFHSWLQGGGGAILGWVLGLIVAGVFFGPTTYCTTLCPTGAVFSLLGRFRAVRLRIEEPKACGANCHRCDLVCWLSLSPSTGDSGADCDNCARCAMVCPHDNLRIGLFHGKKKALPVLMTSFLVLCAPSARAGEPYVRPVLLLDVQQTTNDVTLSIGVHDLSNVRLNADSATTVGGSEIAIGVSRGARAATDGRGRMPPIDHYAGALTVDVERFGERLTSVTMDAPNSPISTVNRKVFTKRISDVIAPGDVVVVHPVAGWIPSAQRFTVAAPSRTGVMPSFLVFLLAGILVHAGMLSLALVVGGRNVDANRAPSS